MKRAREDAITFENRKYPDFTINGIQVNKCILCKVEFFDACIRNAKNNKMTIPDIDEDVLMYTLKKIYNGDDRPLIPDITFCKNIISKLHYFGMDFTKEITYVVKFNPNASDIVALHPYMSGLKQYTTLLRGQPYEELLEASNNNVEILAMSLFGDRITENIDIISAEVIKKMIAVGEKFSNSVALTIHNKIPDIDLRKCINYFMGDFSIYSIGGQPVVAREIQMRSPIYYETYTPIKNYYISVGDYIFDGSHIISPISEIYVGEKSVEYAMFGEWTDIVTRSGINTNTKYCVIYEYCVKDL